MSEIYRLQAGGGCVGRAAGVDVAGNTVGQELSGHGGGGHRSGHDYLECPSQIPWGGGGGGGGYKAHGLSVQTSNVAHLACVHNVKTLQHTATHYNTLQHPAFNCNTPQHTAPNCNALQHTAFNCNTQQYTAPNYNALQKSAALLPNPLLNSARDTKYLDSLLPPPPHGYFATPGAGESRETCDAYM